MSEPRFSWIMIESSGVINIFFPSYGELNFTPSSEILLNSPRLHTWNPPESVKIGLSQLINLCNPPNFLINLSPGRNIRWKVLPRIICECVSFKSSIVSPFTVPFVPTGIKAGVWITPLLVWISASRAFSEVLLTLNFILF